MLKKIGFAALAVVAGLFVLNSTHLGSYAKTAWHKVKKSAKCQVPLEFQLETARTEIAQLIPDIRNHINAIAQEKQAVDRLKEEIAVTKANLDEQKKRIYTMKEDLKKGEVKILYHDKFYSAERVRNQLARDLASCQRCEKQLESREKMLDAKERALDAAKEQLATIRTQKQELELQVEQIEADLKQVRLSQAQCKIQIDDSALAQCKKTLADIQNRLKVEKKTAELSGDFANDNTIPVELRTKSTAELQKDIQTYFGERFADEGKVVERK